MISTTTLFDRSIFISQTFLSILVVSQSTLLPLLIMSKNFFLFTASKRKISFYWITNNLYWQLHFSTVHWLSPHWNPQEVYVTFYFFFSETPNEFFCLSPPLPIYIQSESQLICTEQIQTILSSLFMSSAQLPVS